MKKSPYHLFFTAAALLLAADPATAIIWDGSSSGNWNTTANWDLNRVPNNNEDVIFPAAGLNKTMNNDRPALTLFDQLTFSGSGYTLGGAALRFANDPAALTVPSLRATHTTGTTTLSAPITLGEFTRFSVAAGGTLAFTSTADITIVGNNLELAVEGLLDVNSTITGGGQVTVSGTGTVRMDAPQSFGNLILTGELIHSSTMTSGMGVSSTGLLRGTGTVGGNVSLSGDGDIDPGDATATGRLIINGDLTFIGGIGADTAFFDLIGTTAGTGYDQLRVGGAVIANGGGITLRPTTAFPVGTEFILIDKTSVGGIDSSPTFSGISEGLIRVEGVNAFRFSYVGGDGNDFTATVVNANPGVTRTWSGGAPADLLWSSAANWSPAGVPTAGSILNFGGVATADVATVNDIGGNFSEIRFTGTVGGFNISPQTLGGNPLTLGDGITASHSGAACTVSNNLILGDNQTFSLTGAANLVVGAGTSLALNGFDLTARCEPSNGTPQLNLDAGISGTGSLTKTGDGRVQMGGVGLNNAYTGTTTVQEGELRLTRTTIIAPNNCIPGALVIGSAPIVPATTASVTSTQNEKIADTAAVTVNATGSFLPGGNETIGSLTINGGTVNAGTRTLTINGALTANSTTSIPAGAINFGGTPSINVAAGTTLTISPAINSFAALSKTGPGKVIINGVFSQPAFTISAGTVEMNGDASQTGTFTLQSGGTVSGEGFIETLSASAGGIVEPLAASTLEVNTFTGGSTAIFRPDISTSSTASMLDASTINLGSMKLDPVLTTAAVVGDVYVILSKPGSAVPVATRFTTMAGVVLAPNDILKLALGHFRISYSGGDGNDITLTAVVPAASGVTRVWDGGDAADAWRSPLNWVGDIAPLPGDSLEFPADVHLAAANDFPAGMTLGSIRFTGVAPNTSNRTLTGNAIHLLNGISSSVTAGATGASRVDLPVTFLSAATITNTGTRALSHLKTLTSTLSPLRFTGAGDATQPKIDLFSTTPISGPAQVRVEGNALLNVSSSAVGWVGGTVVEHGALTSSHACAIGGITVGLGTQIATAVLSGQNQTFTTPIVVNALGSLTMGSSIHAATTVNSGSLSLGDPTLNGPLTLNGTATCSAGVLTVAGSFTLNDTASLTATAIKSSGGPRTLTAAPGASITTGTLGDTFLASQNILFNGGGSLRVNTLLASDSLEIAGGSFRQDGNITSPTGTKGAVLLNGGRLTGTGRVKAVTVSATGGTFAPGASPGLFEVNNGGTQLNAASTLQMEINGPLPGTGYDRLIDAAPDMLGAALQLTLSPAYTPIIGQEFVLVQNLRAPSLAFASGFAGISEGTTAVLAPGITVRYSYIGGDGNDFSATVTTSPAGAFRTWDGGAADANWMTPANWIGDIAPQAGESLLFPAGAAQLSSTNNFPSGTVFNSLRITGNHALSTGSLKLTGDLTANLTSTATVSGVSFQNDVVANHAIHLEGTGSLNITGNINLANNVALTLRRTDAAGTLAPLLVAGILSDAGATQPGLIMEGGGRVHFNAATRNYTGTTTVRHGTLQIIGGSIPGDLSIGGGAGLAVVENPGGTDASGGRIQDAATLTLLPSGTHLMTGASPLERVRVVIYAGGQLIQPAGGRLRLLNSLEVAANTDATINTPTIFDFPSNDTTDILDVAAGGIARLTSTIAADNFQTLLLEKTGVGTLLINGGSIGGSELRITQGFVAPLGSGVTSLSMPVSLRGGSIGGNGRIQNSLSGTTAGGSIAPGGGTDGRGIGTLTVGSDFLPAPQTTLEIELGGAQNDQLLVQGATVDLNNSGLLLSRVSGFTPTAGQTFTILNKTSAGAITRTFGGRPQGSTFNAAGFFWSISYTGGDGNDIVLTAGAPAVTVDLKFTSFSITNPPGGGGGKRFQATISGGTGAANTNIQIEFSEDLQTWITLTSIAADASGIATIDIVDPLAGSRRFYRALIP